MRDLEAVQAALRQQCADVARVTPVLKQAIAAIDKASWELRDLDDRHARDAEQSLAVASAALTSAFADWLEDYVRRSEELCERIAR